MGTSRQVTAMYMLIKHGQLSYREAWDRVHRHPAAKPNGFDDYHNFFGYLRNLARTETEFRRRQRPEQSRQDVRWANLHVSKRDAVYFWLSLFAQTVFRFDDASKIPSKTAACRFSIKAACTFLSCGTYIWLARKKPTLCLVQ